MSKNYLRPFVRKSDPFWPNFLALANMPYLAYVPRIILFLSLSVSFSRSPFASSFVDSTIDRSIYDLSLIYEFSQLSLRRILASYRRFRLRKKEESRLSGYLVIAMTRLFKYLIVLMWGNWWRGWRWRWRWWWWLDRNETGTIEFETRINRDLNKWVCFDRERAYVTRYTCWFFSYRCPVFTHLSLFYLFIYFF